jgi:creatinine amidohydrolase
MTNSIFEETMVNLNWIELKKAVESNAIVLLPIGVIEEHGPHLCLGTDIYTAYIHSIHLKRKLENLGENVILGPPFYWGLCQSTGSFIGSFKIRKETAKALLYDVLNSLIEFGFKNIYGINAHGDIEQNIVILETFKEISDKSIVNVGYPFYEDIIHHYGLNGEEKYLCQLKRQEVNIGGSTCPDVHAGDIETAIIQKFFPNNVDIGLAHKLPNTQMENEKIMEWIWGGKTKELSENGYLGAPSNWENVDVDAHIDDVAERLKDSIIKHLSKNRLK